MWFKRKKRQPGRVAQMPIVQVQYCRLNDPMPDDPDGWAFRWPIEKAPEIGDRVFVPAGGNLWYPAVVVGFGRGDWEGHMKWVRRLATEEEIADAPNHSHFRYRATKLGQGEFGSL